MPLTYDISAVTPGLEFTHWPEVFMRSIMNPSPCHVKSSLRTPNMKSRSQEHPLGRLFQERELL